MGIFDSAGLIKLQEHLLNKSEQNRILSVKLSRVLVVAKFTAETADLPCIKALIDWVESGQMVIGGRTRKDFAEVIKGQPLDQAIQNTESK